MSAKRVARGDNSGFGGPAKISRGEDPAANTEAEAATSRSLEALLVTISRAASMRKWYTGTKNLQLASLELCEACREAHIVNLRVDWDVPKALLSAVDAPRADPEGHVSSRVPPLGARRVIWALPSIYYLSNVIDTFAKVEQMTFAKEFNSGLAIQAWPSRLTKIEFCDGSRFNYPIVSVTWPNTLRELSFGPSFNQTIESVVWPASLQRLTFGFRFNQPVIGVKWPKALLQLTFGNGFNQRIEGIMWPTSLEDLSLGDGFNQPIDSVTWPKRLPVLRFGVFFNQPVDGVTWPPSLRRLTFGLLFKKPVDGVMLPASLQELTFGHSFNQPITGVAWPPSLKDVAFGGHFNQPIEGISWPSSLRRLRLKGDFCQSLRKLGTLMPGLKRLTLQYGQGSHRYRYGLLRGIEWPAGLTHLTVGLGAYLDPVVIPPGVQIFYTDAVE